MNPSVRLATQSDIASLVGLMQDFYAESYVPFDGRSASTAFSRLLANPSRGLVWLLDAGNEAAGYAVLTIGFSMEYGGLEAFVDDLFVRSRFRRQGFARAAVATLVAECERFGVAAVGGVMGLAHSSMHFRMSKVSEGSGSSSQPAPRWPRGERRSREADNFLAFGMAGA